MSFASTLASPATAAYSSARSLLRGGSLRSMARGVGVTVGAGFLAASYQIAYDEGRQFVSNLRTSSAQRRARNNTVVLALIGTDLDLAAQDHIRRSRDALRTAMMLVTAPDTPAGQREIIRKTLLSITSSAMTAE